jgi:hypothetical protein
VYLHVRGYTCIYFYVNSLDRVKSTFKNLCLANPRIKVAGYFSTALCEHDSIQLSCPRTNVAIWGDKKRRVRAANAPKDSFSAGDHHRSRMLSRTCVCVCVCVCVCMCVCVCAKDLSTQVHRHILGRTSSETRESRWSKLNHSEADVVTRHTSPRPPPSPPPPSSPFAVFTFSVPGPCEPSLSVALSVALWVVRSKWGGGPQNDAEKSTSFVAMPVFVCVCVCVCVCVFVCVCVCARAESEGLENNSVAQIRV